ncbi:hypothetical protein CQ019_06540, partial [Arthrobacter sp. MYb229]
MGSRFIRKVRTASGAVAVQIVDQTGRTTTSVEHIGSANTDAELAQIFHQLSNGCRNPLPMDSRWPFLIQ